MIDVGFWAKNRSHYNFKRNQIRSPFSTKARRRLLIAKIKKKFKLPTKIRTSDLNEEVFHYVIAQTDKIFLNGTLLPTLKKLKGKLNLSDTPIRWGGFNPNQGFTTNHEKDPDGSRYVTMNLADYALTGKGEFRGGLCLFSELDSYLHMIHHELVHAMLFLLFPNFVSASHSHYHGKLFRSVVRNFFGHSDEYYWGQATLSGDEKAGIREFKDSNIGSVCPQPYVNPDVHTNHPILDDFVYKFHKKHKRWPTPCDFEDYEGTPAFLLFSNWYMTFRQPTEHEEATNSLLFNELMNEFWYFKKKTPSTKEFVAALNDRRHFSDTGREAISDHQGVYFWNDGDKYDIKLLPGPRNKPRTDVEFAIKIPPSHMLASSPIEPEMPTVPWKAWWSRFRAFIWYNLWPGPKDASGDR